MANVLFVQTAQINSGGGVVTSTTIKGDNTNTYVRGQLCYISGGTAVPVATGAGELDTDSAPFSGAASYCVVLEDYSTKTADYIKVQLVDAGTIFKGEVVDASASDVTMDQTDIGKSVTFYQDASGLWGVNQSNTKPVFYIEDVDARAEPFLDDTLGKDSGGTRHSRVWFRLLNALVS